MTELIIQYWVQWLCGIASTAAVGVCGYLWRRARREIAEQKLLKDGMIAILRDRLYQICAHFLKQGEISASALKNIEHIYNAYHSLGGNGTGKELYEACQKLPKTLDSVYER